MSSEQQTAGPLASGQPSRGLDARVGISLLLSAAAIWLALGAFWIINSTYERYRGRTDLDMPEWFAINVDVMFKVLPIAGLAGVLDVIAGCLFIACARRTGWALRAGFALQWLASAAIVGLLVWSVLPHE